MIKQRKIAGSFTMFDARYEPIITDEGTFQREWNDPEIQAADPRLVWTIVSGDTGNLYLVPGFATVNYYGRVLCQRPWPDEEVANTGYRY